jgi:carbamoyl-phosphate synthase large subunit
MLRKGAEAEGRELVVIGVDSREIPPNVRGLQKVFQVPSPESKDYLRDLNRVIIENDIDLVIPQTTAESSFLSIHSQDLNAKTAVLAGKSFGMLNNKHSLMAAFRDAGLICPKFFLVDSQEGLAHAAAKLGYPERDVVVKLPNSSGMRGIRRLSERSETRDDFLVKKPNVWTTKISSLISSLADGSWPELIVMEFLSGPEYSVDVLRRDGHSIIVPRRRDEIRSGISMATTLDLHPDITSLIDGFMSHYALEGLMGFQFILSKSGPKILECNPRVQGTMVASLVSGVNIVWLETKWHLGLATQANEFSMNSNHGGFMRSWGGALTYADGSIEHF